MSGFNLNTKIQLSTTRNSSYRLSKFGQIEYESVRGRLKELLESLI